MKTLISKATLMAMGVLTMIMTGCTGPGQAKEESRLLTVQGEGIVVGILPDAGGRLVLLRTPTGENWIDSTPTEWVAPHPQPALEAPYSYRLRGGVVWNGPQSAFWTQQNLDSQRKADKPIWPPDPFTEWGRYVVQHREAGKVTLEGPASPITGLRMSKTYHITAPGEITIDVTATNTSAREVLWDLWPVLRVDPAVTVYVPLAHAESMRLNSRPPETPTTLRREADGLVWPGMAADKGAWDTKLFAITSRQTVRCVRGQEQLVMHGSLTDKSSVHPEQAPVEIYRGAGEPPTLEVEMHGSYLRLKTGESMRFAFTLRISSAATGPSPDPTNSPTPLPAGASKTNNEMK